MNKIEHLTQLLNINIDTINYMVIDNKLYHMNTGSLDESLLLTRMVTLNNKSFNIFYNKETDIITYQVDFAPKNDIAFDRYQIIDTHLFLYKDDLRYVIKNGNYLFEQPEAGQLLLIDIRSDNHAMSHLINKHVTPNGTLMSYSPQYIGYPEDGLIDDQYSTIHTHSFDHFEIIGDDVFFVTEAYLDYEFELISKYIKFLNATGVEEKLNIYKNSMVLLDNSNQIYERTKGHIKIFINNKGNLDFTANMPIVPKLNGIESWRNVDKVIKHKGVFSSPFFENFINSFNISFENHFKNLQYDINVNISTVDDIINYKVLADMAKI